MNITQTFEAFYNNLVIRNTATISSRYKRITKPLIKNIMALNLKTFTVFRQAHRENIVWALKKLAEGLWYIVKETADFVLKESPQREYLLIEVKKTGEQFLVIPDKLGWWIQSLDGSSPRFFRITNANGLCFIVGDFILFLIP